VTPLLEELELGVDATYTFGLPEPDTVLVINWLVPMRSTYSHSPAVLVVKKQWTFFKFLRSVESAAALKLVDAISSPKVDVKVNVDAKTVVEVERWGEREIVLVDNKRTVDVDSVGAAEWEDVDMDVDTEKDGDGNGAGVEIRVETPSRVEVGFSFHEMNHPEAETTTSPKTVEVVVESDLM
jgi:hypothetical protein